MAVLRAKKRNALPSNKFADPANRAYPIQDKAHADNAAARLEQQKSSMSPAKYARIKARIRAAQKRFGEDNSTKNSLGVGGRNRSIHIRMSSPDGTRTTIRHTLAAYDDSKGTLYTFVPLDKEQALSGLEAVTLDGDRKLVWVQVARTGAWAGHPQGAFSITPQKLDQMVENFHGQRFQRIQWDFDHYAAYPANSGNLPLTGKPAQGWAYDFKRVGEKLYALTEWGALAKQYIENDQYQGVSPVIDWNGKDRTTGKPIGPVITSIALTNVPFLTDMERPIAASSTGVDAGEKTKLMPLTEVDEGGQALGCSGKYCYSFMSMLPQLKQTFGLHELATMDQVQAALNMYRSHLDALEGDGEGEHEGVSLAPYSSALRTMVNAHAGMDWYAILDIIDELIDAYLDQHGLPDFEESHGPIPGAIEASATPTAATAASIDGANMDKPVVPEAVVAPAETAAVTEVAAPQAEVTPEATVTAASATTDPAEVDPKVAMLALTNAALAAEKAALEAEIERLKAQAGVTAESALSAKVDAAIRTYKTQKGLSEDLRPHLLSIAKHNPAEFDAMYPPVDLDKQHLLQDLTGGGATNPEQPGTRCSADTAPEVVDPKAPTVTPEEKPQALSLNGIMDELKAANPSLTHNQRFTQATELLKARRGQ